MRWTMTVLFCLVTASAVVAQTDDSAPNLVSAEICEAEGSVWAYREDGVYDVFRYEDDTQVNLTNDEANDYFAAISPDREQIAFISDRRGDVPELYVMSPEGEDIRQLTYDSLPKGYFNWSLDSRRIAYFAFHNSGLDWQETIIEMQDFADQRADIFVVDVETGDVAQLTERLQAITALAWNTGMTQIAFAGKRDGVMGIYTVPAEGGDVRLVTELDEESLPTIIRWSPDSSHIAYDTAIDAEDYSLYLVEVATGIVNNIYADRPSDFVLFISWTADSTSIIQLNIGVSQGDEQYEMVNIETGEVSPIWEFTAYAACLENVRATNAMLSGEISTP